MMKKSLLLASLALLVCANAFATYFVVLRNGTSYKAKAKWTVVNGKAMVALENGQTLQLDPALIDEAKSEQTTRSGLGDATIISLENNEPVQPKTQQQPSLGSGIKLKPMGGSQPAASTSAAAANAAVTPPLGSGAGSLSNEVIEKFGRAYENVGLFEQKVISTGAHSLRVEVTADSEDKVFNAISATSFLMVRNAGVAGTQIDLIELFMRTTNGGSSGRFQMTRADAEMLDTKQMSQQDYFVHKVIF